jgi:hypothetical protein
MPDHHFGGQVVRMSSADQPTGIRCDDATAGKLERMYSTSEEKGLRKEVRQAIASFHG